MVVLQWLCWPKAHQKPKKLLTLTSKCETSNGVSLQGYSWGREMSQHQLLTTPLVKRLDLKLMQKYRALLLSCYFPSILSFTRNKPFGKQNRMDHLSSPIHRNILICMHSVFLLCRLSWGYVFILYTWMSWLSPMSRLLDLEDLSSPQEHLIHFT